MSTTLAAERFAVARRVADAVLREGYVLFPYRASAQKNRYRWQFGVIVGEAQEPLGTGEPSQIRSECLLRVGTETRVEVVARWIHVQRREVQRAVGDGRYETVERLDVGDELVTTFDEGVEREIETGALRASELMGGAATIPFAFEAAREVELLHVPRAPRWGAGCAPSRPSAASSASSSSIGWSPSLKERSVASWHLWRGCASRYGTRPPGRTPRRDARRRCATRSSASTSCSPPPTGHSRP